MGREIFLTEGGILFKQERGGEVNAVCPLCSGNYGSFNSTEKKLDFSIIECMCRLFLATQLAIIQYTIVQIAALEFQHFLPQQIKCQGNYMKIHFALALPQQCFCRHWQDLILRALAFTWATSAKTSIRSKPVSLLPLLHISPRIGSIVYNSIQNSTRSLVYIQSKAPSSICSSVRNDNYNPFHEHEK